MWDREKRQLFKNSLGKMEMAEKSLEEEKMEMEERIREAIKMAERERNREKKEKRES